jgi:hypothetical protein
MKMLMMMTMFAFAAIYVFSPLLSLSLLPPLQQHLLLLLLSLFFFLVFLVRKRLRTQPLPR